MKGIQKIGAVIGIIILIVFAGVVGFYVKNIIDEPIISNLEKRNQELTTEKEKLNLLLEKTKQELTELKVQKSTNPEIKLLEEDYQNSLLAFAYYDKSFTIPWAHHSGSLDFFNGLLGTVNFLYGDTSLEEFQEEIGNQWGMFSYTCREIKKMEREDFIMVQDPKSEFGQEKMRDIQSKLGEDTIANTWELVENMDCNLLDDSIPNINNTLLAIEYTRPQLMEVLMPE